MTPPLTPMFVAHDRLGLLLKFRVRETPGHMTDITGCL